MIKTIKPQDATAGCKKMLTTEGISLIADALGDVKDPIDFAFLQGLLAGLNFPTIPKGEDVYGYDISDYACNALVNVKDEIMRQAIADGHVNVTIVALGRKEESKEASEPVEGDAESLEGGDNK